MSIVFSSGCVSHKHHRLEEVSHIFVTCHLSFCKSITENPSPVQCAPENAHNLFSHENRLWVRIEIFSFGRVYLLERAASGTPTRSVLRFGLSSAPSGSSLGSTCATSMRFSSPPKAER